MINFPFIPFFIILAAFFLSINFFTKYFVSKLFISMYVVSTVFYGIFGVWYWLELGGGSFLGLNWSEELSSVPWVFSAVGVFVIVLSSYFDKFLRRNRSYGLDGSSSKSATVSFVLMAVGIFACAYTYLVGSTLKENGMELTQDPFALILYQFSDIPIAVVLYKIAQKNVSIKWKVSIFLYLLYALIIGFRYRLILLAFPLLILWFATSDKSKFRKITLSISGFLLLIAVFAILTISRSKFSGVDLDAILTADGEMLLYGLFADTNILFGWLSAKSIFGRTIDFVGMQPIYDMFIQFVPRFLYPEKDLYRHLWDVNYGLGGTDEAYYSGTAMPYFGEYYASAGYGSMLIGVFLYVALTFYMLRKIIRRSVTYREMIVGCSLIVVFMGYYYFSRGSIGQIFKGLVFIVFPYYYLVSSGRYFNKNINDK